MVPGGLTMSQRSTLKFFRLRRADYLLKSTSVSCTFWEPDPLWTSLWEAVPSVERFTVAVSGQETKFRTGTVPV
jgi:hypothetical protein